MRLLSPSLHDFGLLFSQAYYTFFYFSFLAGPWRPEKSVSLGNVAAGTPTAGISPTDRGYCNPKPSTFLSPDGHRQASTGRRRGRVKADRATACRTGRWTREASTATRAREQRLPTCFHRNRSTPRLCFCRTKCRINSSTTDDRPQSAPLATRAYSRPLRTELRPTRTSDAPSPTAPLDSPRQPAM